MTRAPKFERQRGVAVITALLLTALAITIVASLFWQQQVLVRSMENQRLHLQTKWILLGGIDFSRFFLHEDALSPIGRTVTILDGILNTPLAETRLDDYVEREQVEGEKFDATLSGQISDAQARFNLTNLALNRIVDQAQVLAFGRLLQNLRLDPSLAQAVANAIAQTQSATSAPPTTTAAATTAAPPAGSAAAPVATAPMAAPVASSGGSEPMGFVYVEDLLSVPGFTPQAVAVLRDFVVVLPAATFVTPAASVNVNTAPAEVLAAVAGISVSEAAALTLSRQHTYFTMSNMESRLKRSTTFLLAVKSSYFLVSSRVRLDRAALDAQALIYRPDQLSQMTTSNLPMKTTTPVWIREN